MYVTTTKYLNNILEAAFRVWSTVILLTPILQLNHIFLATLRVWLGICDSIRFCIDMCAIGSGFMAGFGYLHN